MNYLIFIDLVARAFAVALAVYFIFILLFGGDRYNRHAFVLVVYSIVYYFMPELDKASLTYDSDYIKYVNISMIMEGATAFAMLLCMPFDKLAKYHAVILGFAVITHCMVYCSLQLDPKWLLPIASGFYYFYDELIILIILLHMAVSYNGFIAAYNNAPRDVQGFVLWGKLYSGYLRKGLLSRKKREIKT